MIPSDYMTLINEVEHRFPVDQWMIDGTHVWPLIRINLATELQFDDARNRRPLSRYQTLRSKVLYAGKRFATYYQLMIADRGRNEEKNAQAEIAVLAGSITRQLRTPWGWFATIPDALREELGWHGARMVFLETAGPVEYRTPRYSASMPVDPGLFYGLVRTKLQMALTSQSSREVNRLLPGFSEFERYLTAEGVKAKAATPENVVFAAQLIAVYVRFYRSILRPMKPKVGLVVGYYTMEGMAFCACCRQLDIPCYDIQHGLAGELHRGYGRWQRLPPHGYNVLPTGFWCWSREDADAINAWNRQLETQHNVIVGGNLWAEYWRSERSSKVRASFDRGIEALGERSTSEIRILYTMQDPDLPELLLRAIDESPSHFRWLIRLHPNSIRHEDPITARFHNTRNVEVGLATRLPLYLLLAEVDVHVTQWSAVVRDASSCRVPSVVIHEIGEDMFSAEIEAGQCMPRYDIQGLLEAIEHYGRRPVPADGDGYSENGVRTLLDIIGTCES